MRIAIAMRIAVAIIIRLAGAFLIVAGGLYLFSLIEPDSIVVNEYKLFKDLLYVFLAIGTLFTGVIYYMLNRRIREDARTAAEQEYRVAIVRLLTHSSSLYGRMFENLHQLPTTSMPYLISLVDMAVHWGKEASELAERLDKKTQGRVIVGAKNNYVMALALNQDKIVAKEGGIEQIIHYLEQELPNYPLETRANYEETIAFARWRLPRSEEDIKQARNTLKQLRRNPNIKATDKDEWKLRWKRFPKGNI